ncbi:rac GTPase-activating protein 1-like isoform X1 [Pantherophis guttatus]|uniref:Rac GTPase-activating protein 1-like isoform X1 n=2 Tax=Pantherophis guttatus TaxID=94885 RepID=A0A6P9D1H0_PANGU|nr:rac GTPase-activating protein 1-like isoform X1 [Pantherophis guttatus]
MVKAKTVRRLVLLCHLNFLLNSFFSRMHRFGPLLMQHLDQLLELANFNSNVEEEYLQIAKCLEEMRQRCCRLDCDLQKTRQQLRQSESKTSLLEVKLKHARNQVEVEMKKRRWAEAELEKQECKLQLIYDHLMADPQITSLTEDKHADLAIVERLRSCSSLLPRKQGICAIEEPGTSILSDISFDHSDEEVDVKMIKSKNRVRLSLAPLVQPAVAAKHSQHSGAFTNNVKELPRVTLRPRASGGRQSLAHSLSSSAVPLHCQPQLHGSISTHSELTSIRNSTDESGRQNSQIGSKTIGPTSRETIGAFIHSSGMPPLQQHQFASKMVIRLDWCVVCKSRLRFGRMALKCRSCQLLMHPECKEQCPSPCVPGAHSRVKKDILADFAPSKPPLVPPIVVQCVVQIEKRGLQEAGLYRVPGAEPLVREWKYKLLSAQGALPSLDLVTDVHVICSILKDFLRNLKEPLVTFCLHSAFLQAAEILDESACHTELCRVVMKLPLTNRDTLAFLMLHLHRVMQSPDCRMDRHNLARIFGPPLVGHSTPSPSPLAIMEDTPRQFLVVSHLLALPLKFWKHFIEEEQENLVPSVHQPIVMNEQEASTVQLSPGNACFPNKLRNCMGTALPPLNVSHAKKMGRFLPLPK